MVAEPEGGYSVSVPELPKHRNGGSRSGARARTHKERSRPMSKSCTGDGLPIPGRHRDRVRGRRRVSQTPAVTGKQLVEVLEGRGWYRQAHTWRPSHPAPPNHSRRECHCPRPRQPADLEGLTRQHPAHRGRHPRAAQPATGRGQNLLAISSDLPRSPQRSISTCWSPLDVSRVRRSFSQRSRNCSRRSGGSLRAPVRQALSSRLDSSLARFPCAAWSHCQREGA